MTAIIRVVLTVLTIGYAPPTSNPAFDASLFDWYSDLAAARRDASKHNRLVLVRAGAEWCGWCKKFEKELSNDSLSKELGSWTLMYLDIDHGKSDAAKLQIGPIPALRILTPTGRVVTGRDGFAKGDELAEWLKDIRSKTDLDADVELSRTEAPDDAAISKIVKQLRSREVSIREAAIRRLLPHPTKSAVIVVDSLAQQDLSVRLSAFELLQEWRAPLEGLDPWQPESFTPNRLAGLKKWAADPAAATGPLEQLAAESLRDAKNELSRYLLTDDEIERLGIRERLGRLSDALRPLLSERLAAEPSDRDRQLLTELRYRIIASDSLVLGWADGLTRLSSLDAETRHEAAEELAKRATDADSALVAELFADSDPVVRELSLKALRSISGDTGVDLLVKLLNDPDANVKAAVLKMLAEKPTPAHVAKVAKYVESETDPDLVVHAIRVLKQSKKENAVATLTKLLDHAAWQVRAEAAEALGEGLSNAYQLNQEVKAAAYAALILRLDDEDAFVVSRAMGSLRSSEVSSMITSEKVRSFITKHPALAADAVRLLSGRGGLSEGMEEIIQQSGMSDAAFGATKNANHLDLLQELCGNENAAVRAVAVEALCKTSETRSRPILGKALADSDSQVRMVAALGIVEIIAKKNTETPSFKTIRPWSWRSLKKSVTEAHLPLAAAWSQLAEMKWTAVSQMTTLQAATQPTTSPSKEVKLLKQPGAPNPPWLSELEPRLTELSRTETGELKVASNVAIAAMGRPIDVLPALMDSVKTDEKLLVNACAVLRWLTPAKRAELIRFLLKPERTQEQIAQVVSRLGQCRDSRTAEAIWRVLDRTGVANEVKRAANQALVRIYLGQTYFDRDRMPKADTRRLLKVAKAKLESPSDASREVALSLLAEGDRDSAVSVAKELFESPKNAKSIRTNAFLMALALSSESDGMKFGLKGLADADLEIRKLAIGFLATGSTWSLSQTFSPPSNVYMSSYSFTRYSVSGTRTAIEVKPRKGLKMEDVRPFLNDSDANVRAHASYLMATLGDGTSLDGLVRRWRESAQDESSWRKLVYQAITALNDDKLTPVLEDIYRLYDSDDYDIPEFYWTIRSMEGPRVERLRKLIRKEVGMDRLK